MRCVSYTGAKPWERCESGYVKCMERQAENIEKYIRQHTKLVSEKVYTEFEELVEDGMRGKYDCIIFSSIYYCGANIREARNILLDTLYEAGIHFIIAEDDIWSSRMSTEQLYEYFEKKRREMHSYITKEWKSSKGPGYVLSGSVPYGYLKCAETGRLIKDTEVSYYVEEIFRRSEAGRSLKEIAAFLNEAGADTPLVHKKTVYGRPVSGLNNQWDENKVRRIIKNPVYTGVISDSDRNIIAVGMHEPYISRNIYKAKKYKVGQYRSVLETGEDNALFSQYIYCKRKGRRLMHRRLKGTGKYSTYCQMHCECHDYGCISRIPYSEIHNFIIEKIDDECRLAKTVLDSIDDNRKTKAYRREKQIVQDDINVIIENMKPDWRMRVSLYQDYICGKISGSQYNSSLSAYKRKYNKLNSELEGLIMRSRRLDILYSKRNPWLELFTTVEPGKIREPWQSRKLIDKIIIDTLHHGEDISAEVCFKCTEWRNDILRSYTEEVAENGKEKQKA